MAKYQRVRAGETWKPPQATTWNSILAATEKVEMSGVGGGGGSAGTVQSGAGDRGEVLVKNTTESLCPRFGVLGIDGVLIPHSVNSDEFKNRVALTGATPTAGTHEGNYVVTLEPIAAGKIGRAVIDGVVQVQVDMTDRGNFAGIIDSDLTKLRSGKGSAKIVWAAGTSGTQWAVVQLGCGGTETFIANITGNASLATNRWKYAWSEVVLNGDATAAKTGARSGTTGTDYAINLAEMNHTSQYAWGVDIDGSDYPGGFVVQPIGGGGSSAAHRYNVPVIMHAVTDKAGDTKYYFSMMGTHDGTCSA